MKRALFFILDGVGGAERISLNIAKMLPESEWNVCICICKAPNKYAKKTSGIEDFIPDRFATTSITLHGQLNILRSLNKIIKKYSPDVVFASAMHINQRLMLLSLLHRDKHFIIRNDNYLYTLPRLKRLTLRITYRFAQCIIAQTEEMKSELEAIGLNPSRIHVLHNPLDKDLINSKVLATSPYENNNGIIFVAVGRFAYEKGFDLLVRAFKIVHDSCPDSKLYIVGDTNYGDGAVYSDLCHYLSSNGLNDSVFCTGYTDNPYRYIANANVFVLSSRNEGLPNVLIEAQYLGVPAAAFRCIPIIERIVKEGVNGYTAPTEDVEALAEAMLNTSKLGKKVPATYHGAGADDFIRLFNV